MMKYDAQTNMLDREIQGKIAWKNSQVSEADWLIQVSDDFLEEVDQVIDVLSKNPVETTALCVSDYPMPHADALMAKVKTILDEGVGFAIVDKLDTEKYSKQALTQIYWLLSSRIARPVAQAFDGRLLYDVRDTGKRTDVRVRGDLTNQELSWHSDYGFNFAPPYLGLLVLRTAKEGGISKAGSLLNAHNELRKRDPSLMQRLYEPFYWNRQGEHAENEHPTHYHSMFQSDGVDVRARYNRSLIPVGYELEGKTLDAKGRAAIDAISEILSEPENHVTFTLVAGQMQFVNNFKLAHLRSDYVDFDEPDRKRHLIRIFLRDYGRRSYMG
jgi:alpha-ketoglutarate-dependent taurine dioxygenase